MALRSLSKERREWRESGQGGGGEREDKEYFFPPLSLPPFPSFAIAPTLRAAIFTHPNLPVIQSNTTATTIRT